ncbi:MAG: DNA polymerase III subunit beta [Cystobacterineae bacterium]|nr:DNA polymerase III subunit beta [Cystobacterineae bacterium]
MEFQISTDELRKALARAQGVVERKATMPILSHVLVQAKPQHVCVTAFDLDVGLSSDVPAQVSQTGAVALSAKHLLDIVQNLPEAQVSFSKKPNNHVEMNSGSANYRLVGLAEEEFPKLPARESAPWVSISALNLLEMIRRTSFAISTDETRYHLNGVFFEPRDDNKVRMVATDGHRLAMVERELGAELASLSGAILPRKGLLELRKLLDEAPEAEVQLAFVDNLFLFKRADLSMVMRLVDGQFPDYQRVIPKQPEHRLSLPRMRLSEGLKRIALLSTEKSNAVRLGFSQGLLRISTQNPDLGEARDDISVDYKGEELSIGFNARYLLDVLGVLSADEVLFSLGDEHSPAVIQAPDDESYLAVVMPMRV